MMKTISVCIHEMHILKLLEALNALSLTVALSYTSEAFFTTNVNVFIQIPETDFDKAVETLRLSFHVKVL